MEHPITPPPRLLEQWLDLPLSVEEQLEVAARWGADQELETCCGWIESLCGLGGLMTSAKFRCMVSDRLRAARRPKPQSLKQQAQEALDQLQALKRIGALDCNIDAIRRALESLPDPQD